MVSKSSVILSICFILIGCGIEQSQPPFVQEPAVTGDASPPIPPPVQGPAVIGDDAVGIEDWEYLGPNAIQALPLPQWLGTDAREVGTDLNPVWLVPNEGGFDLAWGQFPCATQPVVVVHANNSIEFWPGDIVGEDCDAMGTFHLLTVKLQPNIPLDQWQFTLHPPSGSDG